MYRSGLHKVVISQYMFFELIDWGMKHINSWMYWNREDRFAKINITDLAMLYVDETRHQ